MERELRKSMYPLARECENFRHFRAEIIWVRRIYRVTQWEWEMTYKPDSFNSAPALPVSPSLLVPMMVM